MPIAYIGLGSNLQNPRRQIRRGINRFRRTREVRVIRVAPAIVTAPWGCNQTQPAYVNTALRIQTRLAAKRLLRTCQRIERESGRRRTGFRRARTLDCDILCYSGFRCDSKQLTVPHPALPQRDFALRPLAAIAPSHQRIGDNLRLGDVVGKTKR